MSDCLVVNVKQGRLCGSVLKNVDGGTYVAFKGIPFARPPIKELRFKDPQPPLSWSGIRDVSKNAGDVCAQVDTEFSKGRLKGTDDCLYLNVYTVSIDRLKPVMVWIHGGGFMTGSGNSDTFGPDYLVKKDIVLVCINYRVGILGFLNLDHEVAPGNQGLKDQVAALKWVKENISAFGGDPNNVTIFGDSAGGCSVHYLTLSPLAKGLFHKGICQSGTCLIPVSRRDNNSDRAYKLAAYLGNNTTDPIEIVEFLRTVPVLDLIKAQQKISIDEHLPFKFVFGPNIDDKSREPFLPRPIHEILNQGNDVPLLIGYSSQEAILFCYGMSDKDLETFESTFENILTTKFPTKNAEEISVLTRQIREIFFDNKPINRESIKNLTSVVSNIELLNGVHDLVTFRQTVNSPTYYYRFSYEGQEPTITTFHLNDLCPKGSSHGDILSYLFYLTAVKVHHKDPPAQGTRDRRMLEQILRMWTDFAKTGNPTPRIDDLITVIWKPISKTTLHYLEINDDLLPGVNPDANLRAIWKKIL